jgi:hypothetical protein
MDAAPELGDSRPQGAVLALVCSAIGAPFCLRLMVYYVADPGSGWFFRLVSQDAHGWLRGTLDFGSTVALALAVVGAVLGAFELSASERRGMPSRPARFAFYLGLADIAAVAAGVLALYLLALVH